MHDPILASTSSEMQMPTDLELQSPFCQSMISSTMDLSELIKPMKNTIMVISTAMLNGDGSNFLNQLI